MQTSDFLPSARLDAASLDAWVTAGWLAPRRDGAATEFSDVDVARARLIHDLRDMGVNDDGISVILDLIDQLHGLRRLLRELMLLGAEQRDRMQGDPPDCWAASRPGSTAPRNARRPSQ
jgi:chaperone modulatory protein CbpM